MSKIKIAFASKDNIHINQHFGWCENFYIYEITQDDYSFLDCIDSSLQFDAEVEKLEYKISCLEDSDLVYVSQIGPKAAAMVQSAGIYPLKSVNENEEIEEVIGSLQRMMSKENAPLWLKRIMLKGSMDE